MPLQGPSSAALWALGLFSLLGMIVLAMAREAGRGLCGVEEQDRQRLYQRKSAASWISVLGWTAGFFLLSETSPVMDRLGLRPLNPLPGLVLFLAGFIALACLLELAFAPLQDRVRGVGHSRWRSVREALRETALCLGPVLLYQVVWVALVVVVVRLLPPGFVDRVPPWLGIGVLLGLALGSLAYSAPTLMCLMLRARRVPDGPVVEAARRACAKVGCAPPAVYMVPTDRESRVRVLTTLRGRLLVSENAREALGEEEFDAVLAHEAVHLRERHVAKNLGWAFLVCWADLLSIAPVFDSPWLAKRPWLIAFAGLLNVFACLAVMLWFQRRAEYVADRAAVLAGAGPEAMLSGLEKIHRHNGVGRRWSRLDRFFVPHPSMEDRAAALRRIASSQII